MREWEWAPAHLLHQQRQHQHQQEKEQEQARQAGASISRTCTCTSYPLPLMYCCICPCPASLPTLRPLLLLSCTRIQLHVYIKTDSSHPLPRLTFACPPTCTRCLSLAEPNHDNLTHLAAVSIAPFCPERRPRYNTTYRCSH